MLNKIITVVDINSNNNQYLVTLLLASILEKKYSKVSVIDLNLYDNNLTFVDKAKAKEKDEIFAAKVFDRCSYIFMSNQANLALKMQNFAKTQADKNDVLIINPNYTKFDLNTFFFELSNEIILFADIKKDISSSLIKFFIQHGLSNKKIHVYAYNYIDNMQNRKTFLSMIKPLKTYEQNKNIVIDTIESIPNFKSLNDICKVDPWTDLYKKINGEF